jgi:hypothetical protein
MWRLGLRSRASLCVFASILLVFAAPAKAQEATQTIKLELTALERFQPGNLNSLAQPPAPETIAPAYTWKIQPMPPLRAERARFILMSVAVYGLAFLDMHETASLKPDLIEHDPLARPFTKLPTPAYYACGAAMTTGVNWIAWKMQRSVRWRKIWWLPQTASASGNLWGYTSTRARE